MTQQNIECKRRRKDGREKERKNGDRKEEIKEKGKQN
jgi:hypothetical protein